MRTFGIKTKNYIIVASVDEGKVVDIGDTLSIWKYKNWEWCQKKIEEYGWDVREVFNLGDITIDFSV
jgi:hypothetical protein